MFNMTSMYKDLLQRIQKKIIISLEKWVKDMNRLFEKKITTDDQNT